MTNVVKYLFRSKREATVMFLPALISIAEILHVPTSYEEE